jgi:F-type H+-transporting ATPase subunit a
MSLVQNFNIISPLDQFEVTSLIGLNAPIFGYINISLTNLGLYSFLILSVIISLHYFSNNNNKIIPSK